MPISTSSTLMIASVIGSVIVIFVPMPTSLAMSTTPPSLPDVRLDDVEPDAAPAEIRRDLLRREAGHEDQGEHLARRHARCASDAVTTPRRTAVARMAFGSMPAPSSSTSMTT